MSDKIAAWTELAGSYPGYANIAYLKDGTVRITVRSPRKEDGSCGDTAAMVVSHDVWNQMLADLGIPCS